LGTQFSLRTPGVNWCSKKGRSETTSPLGFATNPLEKPPFHKNGLDNASVTPHVFKEKGLLVTYNTLRGLGDSPPLTFSSPQLALSFYILGAHNPFFAERWLHKQA